MSLANLIAPLMGRKCAVAYRLAPRTDGRKADKITIDPRTGRNCDYTDSANWFAPDELINAGWPVGLVLHPELNLFCVDLDEAWICHTCQQISLDCKCVDRSAHGWSAFATGICNAFPGAGIEVSVSGRGLHVIAAADLKRVPAHRTSDDTIRGLEIYTRKRFIALTGTGYVGDIRVDHTAMLQAAIAQYLPGDPGIAVGINWWTDGPQWSPNLTHLSDADLIQIMIGSKPSANVAFNGQAGVRELWTGDTAAMIATYPTNIPGKQWDYNRADQALATHIAYFTAGDCERTRRIFFMSGLRREKWDRPDYIRRTITRACQTKIEHARTKEGITVGAAQVLETSAAIEPTMVSAATIPAPPPIGDPPIAAMDAAPATGRKPPGTWMTRNDQHDLFTGVTYVCDIHQALTTDGRLLKPNQFDVAYGGYEFQMTLDGAVTVKSAWECFTLSRCTIFPKVQGVYFDPRQEPGKRVQRDGLVYVNTWMPIDIAATPGDVTRFLQHLHNLLPNERDRTIFLSYMAFVAQFKGHKARWTPLLQGVPGNGKTWLSHVLQYCVGKRYCYWPIAKELGNHFNAGFYGKLLICVDDLVISEAQGSMWEALKPMITNDQLAITPKGVDTVSREICFNLILNANPKDAVRKTRDDRRIAPFHCAQQHEHDLIRYGMQDGGDYFSDLNGWADAGGYANIYHYLLHYPIAEEFHPAGKSWRAPKTSATESAIRASLGIVEQEILECIETGKPGFRNGWISSIAVDQLLERIGKRAVSRNKRAEIIETLGYQVHPDLATGRVFLEDGTHPTLYVTRAGGHESGLTFDQIAASFMRSQR